jgi:hypothetical protein
MVKEIRPDQCIERLFTLWSNGIKVTAMDRQHSTIAGRITDY